MKTNELSPTNEEKKLHNNLLMHCFFQASIHRFQRNLAKKLLKECKEGKRWESSPYSRFAYWQSNYRRTAEYHDSRVNAICDFIDKIEPSWKVITFELRNNDD